MRKLSIYIALLFISNSMFAQGIVDKYYSHLDELESTTSVYVSQAMFEMGAKIDIETDDEEFNNIKEFISSVKSFQLIMAEEISNPLAEYKTGIRNLNDTHEELVRIKDDGERFSVYVDQENDVIYEIAVVGVVDNEFLAASLIGEMDLDKVSEFINQVQNENLAPLKAINKSGAADMKIFPNPASSGVGVTVEVPENMIGGTANVYSPDGQQVKSIATTTSTINIDSAGLPEGSYIVELVKEGFTLKKTFILIQ